nr:hypothetical protein [uncultured Pseudodesulfovibrio sp.]
MVQTSNVPQNAIGARTFVDALFQSAEGNLILFTASNKQSQSMAYDVTDTESIIAAALAKAPTHNVYYGLGLQAKAPAPGKRGKAEDVTCITCLWVEIDVQGDGHKADNLPPTIEEALALAYRFPVPPSIIVMSGGGIHCYWLLDKPLVFSNEEEREAGKTTVRRFQATIRDYAAENDWKVDNTSDISRVLRVPGTLNHKSSPPLPVRIKEIHDDRRYSIEELEKHFIEVPTKTMKAAKATKKADGYTLADDFPPADAEAISKHCEWFRHCRDDAETLPESEWQEMMVMLGKCENGSKLAHEFSSPYPGYSEAETTEKYELNKGYSPRRCETIQLDFGSEHCADCQFNGQIKSPVQLGDPRPKQKAVISLAEVLNAIKDDKDEVYSDDNLDKLYGIQRERKDLFQRFLTTFKEAGGGVTQFSKIFADHARAKLLLGGSPYRVDNNSMVWDRASNAGVSTTVLSNFYAEIVEEITKDDGVNTELEFKLAGALNTGVPLPAIAVKSGEFTSLNWIVDKYGARAIYYPASKDHLRAAIQSCSNAINYRTIYSHFGWRQIGGAYYFLSASGALGEAGLRTEVEVDPGSPTLADYSLTNPPAGSKLIQAVRTSLKLLELVPKDIGYAVLGSIYRTPLNEAVAVDMSLFLFGSTGSGKSELAAVAQRHYGSGFKASNLPANWSSTANANEKLAFIAKDSILVADDFIPKGTQTDIARAHREAERLLRAQGNKAGRARLNQRSGFQTTAYPRGMIVATGEDIPKGQSLRARMLILELGSEDVDLNVLTELQREGDDGVLVQSMSGYLQWLAPQIGQFKLSLPERKLEYRKNAMGLASIHGRTPDMVASLMIGLETFFRFAGEVNAITPQEVEKYRVDAWDHLFLIARKQARYQDAECPVTVYLTQLASALQAGVCHLQDFTGSCPLNPDHWGWRPDPTDQTGQQWKPHGIHVGWINGTDVYLNAQAAFSATQSMAQKQGAAINVGLKTLNKHLKEKKKLKSRGKDGNTIQKRINGKKKPVLHLDAADLGLNEK